MYSGIMNLNMKIPRTHRNAFICLFLCCGFSAFLGFVIQHDSQHPIDFKGLSYFSHCLLQHADPYNPSEPLRLFQADGGAYTDKFRGVVTVNLYPPTIFLLTVPFAMLPWGVAHILWMALSAGCLLLAAILIWDLAGKHSPGVSLFLPCFVLANSLIVFATGNPAAIAVGLCVIAAWCFLEERFVLAGIVCMVVSLAVKPHDSGLVWLYFLLAGGVYRKRALQVLALTAALGLPFVFWVTHVAPNWVQELRSNLQQASASSGLMSLDPSSAVVGSGTSGRVDLQSLLSVLNHDPRFYIPASYLICAPLLLIWAIFILRSSPSLRRASLALATIAPLTILVTYHRPYDAKLLLLTIPACAMLHAEGGRIARMALLMTTLGIVFTADLSLQLFLTCTENFYTSTTGTSSELIMKAVLTKPAPLFLLAMTLFYLWAYWQSGVERGRK